MVFERRKTVKKMDFEVEGLQRRTSKKSWPSEPDTRSSHFGFIVYPIVFAEADSRKISLLKMLLGHPSQSPYHFGIESFHLKVFLLSIFTWEYPGEGFEDLHLKFSNWFHPFQRFRTLSEVLILQFWFRRVLIQLSSQVIRDVRIWFD